MKVLKCGNTNRLDLHEVCEMIADGSSLVQIGVKFERSRNVIMIERLMLKAENAEIRPDFARVAIDGRKWIASRFHPDLLSKKLIGEVTNRQSRLRGQRFYTLGIFLA